MSGMFLYNLTLQRAQAIPHAVYGSFSAPKAQEIVVSRGKVLELLRPDDETGKVQSVLSTEVFGTIRCLQPFRLVAGRNLPFVHFKRAADNGRHSLLVYVQQRHFHACQVR